VGGVAALVAAVTAMAQLQRASTRLYGIETDRSSVKRYVVATVLTLTVGLLITVAFIAIVAGGSLNEAFDSASGGVWSWGRWLGGIAFVVLALGVLFKVAPNRKQPGVTWLAMGGAFAGLAWLIVTVGLSFYLQSSSSFGDTYGPLAGFMGLLLWTQLSSIAILFGMSIAAQLEAVRGGVPSPVAELDRTVSDLSWT
jgi:YihY family inner membrane protein